MVDDIPEYDDDDEEIDEDYCDEDTDNLDYDSRIEKMNDVIVLQETFMYL